MEELQSAMLQAATHAAQGAIAAQRQAGATTTSSDIQVLCDKLTQKLSCLEEDDLSKVHGVPYYLGTFIEGHMEVSVDPETTYDLKYWLAMIDMKTTQNFTDKGRLSVAEKYSRGTGRDCVNAVIEVMTNDMGWDDFKTSITSQYGKKINTRKYRTELHNATLMPNENLVDYYVRLTRMSTKWTKLSNPSAAEASNLVADAIVRVMPRNFERKLPEEPLTPEATYSRAVSYLESHPEAKLKYAEEVRAVLAVTVPAEQPLKCYSCAGNHLRRDCPEQSKTCQKCLLKGHSADMCRTRCYRCQSVGHSTKTCKKQDRRQDSRREARSSYRRREEYRSNSMHRSSRSPADRKPRGSDREGRRSSDRGVSFERSRSSSRRREDRHDRSRSRSKNRDNKQNFRSGRGSNL